MVKVMTLKYKNGAPTQFQCPLTIGHGATFQET